MFWIFVFGFSGEQGTKARFVLGGCGQRRYDQRDLRGRGGWLRCDCAAEVAGRVLQIITFCTCNSGGRAPARVAWVTGGGVPPL